MLKHANDLFLSRINILGRCSMYLYGILIIMWYRFMIKMNFSFSTEFRRGPKNGATFNGQTRYAVSSSTSRTASNSISAFTFPSLTRVITTR